MAGIVDNDLKWSAGQCYFIQTGDIVDRVRFPNRYQIPKGFGYEALMSKQIIRCEAVANRVFIF
jgi:hypothetical protein